MINKLQLMKLNPEHAPTKQKIISVLSEYWPLTTKQVYDRLQREYSTSVSYQAVHKIIKELVEEKVLEKKKEGYQLNLEWILEAKKILEGVEKRYMQNKKIKIPENFQGPVEIEFDSFTDLCVSTAELLLSRQLAKDSKKMDFICTLEYGLWPWKFRFEYFRILEKMMINNPKSKGIISTKTKFGEWILEQYKKIGAITAPIGTKLDIDEDVFVQGNCIIEIKFDPESKKIIEQYYNKWKNMEDIFKQFGLKEEPKIHTTMKITKNPEMAEYLRKQMEKAFEVKT